MANRTNTARTAWDRYRGWPLWARIAAPVLAFIVLAGTFGEDPEDGDGGAVTASLAGRATTTEREPSTTTTERREPSTTTTSTTSTTTTTVATTTTTTAPPGAVTTVARTIDGDTLEVADGTNVRLIGIDTPETVDPRGPVECFGAEASARLRELIPPGTQVRLVYDVERTDDFGRTLAYVYRGSDDLFVNEAMVLDGYAVAATFPPNVRFADRFVDFGRQAREANSGLWNRCGGADTPVTTTTTTAAAPPRAQQAPPTPSGNCHPSYAGACVPMASDVDCASGSGNGPEYVAGPVRVVGDDPYGLDSNGDGIGCERG